MAGHARPGAACRDARRTDKLRLAVAFQQAGALSLHRGCLPWRVTAGFAGLLMAVAALGGVGCSSSKETGEGDGGADAAADATASDVGLPDTGRADGGSPADSSSHPDADAGDAGASDADAATPDAGVEGAGECEACETTDDCQPGHDCASLSYSGSVCLKRCDGDCAPRFECTLCGIGVGESHCCPIGTGCCVDFDSDGYGQGIDCRGPDCNDDDPLANPLQPERCNGADDDCDGRIDEGPTDCASGRCRGTSDGTYTAVEGASCEGGDCSGGTRTDCGLYSCDGGETGTACATSCGGEAFCVGATHCDDGECFANVEDGGACDENSDCISGHCENMVCCTGFGNVCCDDESDCAASEDCVDNICRGF